ncbi:MAG: 5-oxoprolinase subunit PxpA [Tissierellia bacterium]|nr:5-oxoprolinase subunit PxpA [Tissierellia bacterium]
MTQYVDLNSDLGEGFGAYKMGMDEDILKLVTSANVACGWHAGDPGLMNQTVGLVKKEGVALGAHPSYPDLLGFGRRKMDLSYQEMKDYVAYQVGALDAFARAHDLALQHIKLHGAFYNQAMADPDLAKVLMEACLKIWPDIYFLALSGSPFARAGQAMGVKVAQEVFADRAYREDGRLVSRKEPGALIEDEDLAISRTLRMVKEGRVKAITGQDIDIVADSICVHGDNPQALNFVRKIAQALEEEGVVLRAFGQTK